MEIDPDVIRHYEERYDEDTRLERDPSNRLELIRTRQLLDRYLPEPPAAIVDVGGGPGSYAVPLAEAGYDVELIDLVPRHIRLATERGIRAQLGDARNLPIGTKTQDAVLLLGPLYHLVEREQRLAALEEAIRVGKSRRPRVRRRYLSLRPGHRCPRLGVLGRSGVRPDSRRRPGDGSTCQHNRQPGLLHHRILPPAQTSSAPR